MTENMKKFMEFILENQDAFPKLHEMSKEEIIAAAKTKGIELIHDDFDKQNCELTDDELAAAAGGKDDVCACVVYSVGTGEGSKDRCACSIGGQGKSLN